MTLQEYQSEYDRLFRWRDVWTKLSNRRRFRLAVTQEAIERRARIANEAIGRLMAQYDSEHPNWREEARRLQRKVQGERPSETAIGRVDST